MKEGEIYQYKRDIESGNPSVEESEEGLIFHLDRFNHVTGVVDNKEKKGFGKVIVNSNELIKDEDTKTFVGKGYQELPDGEKIPVEITGYLNQAGNIDPRKGCGLFSEGAL